MEVILIMLVLVLIVFMAVCWVQRDSIQELGQKNETSTKEIIRLQQRNYLLEAENKALRCNTKDNQEIICYECSNQDCGNACRFTVGAKGCKKYRRQE
jgi:cell division protein FtsB